LSQKGARFFLNASQLLNDIKANLLNIAGVLFWDKSVLCTHLDVTTTRWILNLVCIMKANSRHRDASKRVQHVDDAERSSHHPFLTSAILTNLKIVPKSTGQEEPAMSLYVPESSRSTSNIQQQRVSRLSEVLLRKHGEGEYVGLYIICLKNISLAVLMNLQALHDTRHINTIKSCFSELFSLEQNLSRALKTSPPNRRLFHAVSVKKPSNPVESSQKFYNFLMFDSMTGQARGTVPMTQKEVDRSFLHMTSKAHNSFEKDPELSQMLMRDNNGLVYCRRTMGREIYYQQFQQQKTHYEFIHRIEKTVRNAMQEEQGLIAL